ncbi:MAG: hypothetical protein ABR543_07615 [Gemmatimonadaceae bacterium]
MVDCLRTPPPGGPGLPPEDAAVHIRLNQPRSLDLRTASGEVIQVTAAEILIGRLRPSRSPDSVRIFVSEVRQPFGDRRKLPLGTMAVLARDSSMKMTVITANRPAMRQSVATVLGFVAGAVIAIALVLSRTN